MLAPRESEFQSLLEEVRGLSLASGGTASGPRLRQAEFADLTQEVLAILKHLETRKSPTLSAFLEHETHEDLARWMGSLCRELAATEGKTNGVAFRRLLADFNNGRLRDEWGDVFSGRMGKVSGVGTMVGILEPAVSQQLSVLGALGLATALITTGEPCAKKIGLADVEFTGPNWPFIYAFDAGPRKGAHAQLKSALDAFVPTT